MNNMEVPTITHASRLSLCICAVILLIPFHLFAKPRWPLPPIPDPSRSLNHWHFDGTNLWDAAVSEQPSEAVNVQLIESSSGYAAGLQGKEKALLRFPAVNANKILNLNLASGAVRLWFAPNWSSGA